MHNIIHVPYIISFSKMYKHKSGWQKTKERAVTDRESRPYQKTKNLAFFTNTFTDIATEDSWNDDRDLHNEQNDSLSF